VIEVRVEATNAERFRWVGHGVGNTPDQAEAQAARRLPEGYVFTSDDVTVTREEVDPATIHSDWLDRTPAPVVPE